MRVSVIVVAYRGAQWIPKCLESLALASTARVQLCLVENFDNGSAIPRELACFDYILLKTPEPVGFAEANNYALRAIGLKSDLVCFLNQDTHGEPGWLDACAACFRDVSQLGAASPLLRTYDGNSWDPGFEDCLRTSPTFRREMSNGNPSRPLHLADRVTAAAMLIRTDVLRMVGPFDPIFGSYYEDYDLCRRVRLAGFEVGICAKASVFHHSGSSTTTEAASRKRAQQILKNRAILDFREAGRNRWPAIARYLGWTLPRNLSRGLAGTRSSQPVGVQLAAYANLLHQWKRLVSSSYDQQAWLDYLESIDWPMTPSREPQNAMP